MNRSLLPIGLVIAATAVLALSAYFFIRPPVDPPDPGDTRADHQPRLPREVEVKPLTVRLEELQAYLRTNDPDTYDAMETGLTALRNARIGDTAPGVGDVMPDFALPANTDGPETVRLSELAADGPVVVCWFRGTWCPFCRSELEALDHLLPRIREAGGRVVGISPQLPRKAREDATHLGIEFPLLHDHNNELARRLNLVYRIPPRILAAYRKDLDLREWNGVETVEEPIPATFLVDRQRVIRFAYVNPDFRSRMNPDDLLAALDELGGQ